jgi:hypothetical protein
MSTSPAYAASAWLPLAPNARGWEAHDGVPTSAAIRAVRHRDTGMRSATATPLPSGVGGAVVGIGGDMDVGGDSMARELGQMDPDLDEVEIRTTSASSADREGAPKIGEVHAWGVEDRWGPRAGRWGQGARVYDEEGTEGQAAGRLRWRRGGEK